MDDLSEGCCQTLIKVFQARLSESQIMIYLFRFERYVLIFAAYDEPHSRLDSSAISAADIYDFEDSHHLLGEVNYCMDGKWPPRAVII